MFFYLALASLFFWLIILLLPWHPWWTKEKWNVTQAERKNQLGDVTVLIPARNEEEVINRTLRSVASQGEDINIVLVNDHSTDRTLEEARRAAGNKVTIIESDPLPRSWGGKLWALQQGWQQVETRYTLLLDADIEISPGTIAGLKEKLIEENRDLVSLMAMPVMNNFWEKLLMPAFIYFFKLIYPFRLSNSGYRWVAAAAGGCIFLKSGVLKEINGFTSLKSAVIDDCTLARKVKKKGFKIWLGLTHSVKMVRPYKKLGAIWDMIARTAFNQLHYSTLLLLACTFIMIIAFWMPPGFLFFSAQHIQYISLGAFATMIITYLPILLFYGRSPLWALLLPVIGTLYLLMTWTSAMRYWKGEHLRWRGRTMQKSSETAVS